jgi:hypothetical protein
MSIYKNAKYKQSDGQKTVVASKNLIFDRLLIYLFIFLCKYCM